VLPTARNTLSPLRILNVNDIHFILIVHVLFQLRLIVPLLREQTCYAGDDYVWVNSEVGHIECHHSDNGMDRVLTRRVEERSVCYQESSH
jgi:hypothetical protein